MQVVPFTHPGDGWIAMVSAASLVLAMLGMLALKMNVLYAIYAISVMDTGTIVVVLLIAIVLVVGVSITVLFWELSAAIAVYRARRLRYARDDAEVSVPRLRAASYHLFLSHMWVQFGAGQDQVRVVKQRLLEMVPSARVFLDVDGE